MDGLIASSASAAPMSVGAVLILLGAMSFAFAAYAWTSRDVIAQRSRGKFEKVGWTWFLRLINDDFMRKVGVFYGIVFGVIGSVLIIVGVVMLLVPR